MTYRFLARLVAMIALHPITAALAQLPNVVVALNRVPITDGAVTWFVSRGDVLDVVDRDARRIRVSQVATGWIGREVVTTPAAAMELFDREVTQSPKNADAYVARANVFLYMGELQKASRDCDTALELDAHNVTAYICRARCWAQQGMIDKAIVDYNTAITMSPVNPAPLRGRAEMNAVIGRVDAAFADVDGAIRLAPGYAAAHRLHGDLWRSRDKWEAAIGEYTAAIRCNPKCYDAYCGRAAVWMAIGKHDRAIEDFTVAVELSPRHSFAYQQRAQAWIAKGKAENAVNDLLSTLHIDAEDPEALNQLAWLQSTWPDALLRNGARAVEYASKACEITKWNDANCLDTLAAAYAECGDFVQAVGFEKKSLLMAPPNGRAELEARLQSYKSRRPYREKKSPR